MRRALLLIAAVAALVLPAAAQAASPRLTDDVVAGIAARDSHVTAIEATHPLARFSAVYQGSSGTWLATLRELGKPALATLTVRDADSIVTGATLSPAARNPAAQLLTMARATQIANGSAKVRDWVRRYTSHGYKLQTETVWDSGQHLWVRHWWAKGEEIARVQVDDVSGRVRDAWTGPQVAWSMARGTSGAFGKRVNDPLVFLPILAAFTLGLLDWRRLRSFRTLDVLALASFSISLWYFNRGLIFWSVPLSYPPMVYLFGRLLYIGLSRKGAPAFTTRLPIWLCAALAVFALGFRAGLNFWDSNVIDVGYAGVAGASRLIDGRIPYGNMPRQTSTPCGPKYSDGSFSAYRQPDGSCESPVERGDTYGPVMYDAYVPFTAALGWSGRWDDLPAAHGTAVLFDFLAALGLMVAAWRLGGRRLAVAALFFWAAYPFTLYAMSSNSNDAVVAAAVAWTLALLTSPFGRGLLVALGAWAKFAPVLLLPLVVRADRGPYREPEEWAYGARPRLVPRSTPLRRVLRLFRPGPGGLRTLVGFAAGTLLAFSVLVMLDGLHAVRVFWDRTFGWQLDRPSPFSIWDWGGYPGFPNLDVPQKLLKGLLVLLAAGLYLLPRRLDPVRIAALGGALLIGFQLLLTHWFYLYIPWWTPCVAIAMLAPRPALEREPAPVSQEETGPQPATGPLVPVEA